MNTKTYLDELRKSANKQTQGQDKEPLMKRLIKSLNSRDALMVALKQISSYLPTFEKIHPQITWPGEWIEAVGEFEPIEHKAYAFGFYDEEFSDSSNQWC